MDLLDFTKLTEAISSSSQRDDPFYDDVVEDLRGDDSLDIPIEMTDLDVWANYMDEGIYFLDKKIREFLKKTRYKRESKDGYKTTAQVVFSWIFGRYPDPGDGSICRNIHTLLRYYCTRYTGRTTFNGKTVTCVYYFSKFSGNTKRPYSLKLRMEESDGTHNVFKHGPNHRADKRSHGRPADRKDG